MQEYCFSQSILNNKFFFFLVVHMNKMKTELIIGILELKQKSRN